MTVVRDDDERAAEVLQCLRQRLAHLDVEMVRGFVEQQQIGPLAYDQRERQSRLFAAREILDCGSCHVAAEIEAAQEIAELLLPRLGFELPQVPERRVFLAQLFDLVLREVAQPQAVGGMARPCSWRKRAGDRLQQCGLAGAVGAEQADALPRQYTPVDAAEDRRARRVAEVGTFQQHELARGRIDGREGELERAIDVGSGDELHPFQCLDAALGLLRLRRLRAKPVDEGVQVRHLPLLLVVSGLLQSQLLGALALELRIVAGIRGELARIDVDDRVHHAVEKVAIVRDQE